MIATVSERFAGSSLGKIGGGRIACRRTGRWRFGRGMAGLPDRKFRLEFRWKRVSHRLRMSGLLVRGLSLETRRVSALRLDMFHLVFCGKCSTKGLLEFSCSNPGTILERYLRFCFKMIRSTWQMVDKPQCIIVTGKPGVGKSTLSKELAKILYLPVISRDEIKEGYVNTFGIRHDQLPPDSNGVATNIFFETVSFLLARKISLIAEAAFQHGVWKSRMDGLVASASVCFVICSVSGEIAADRHLQRGLNDPKREFYHGDKRVSVFRERGILEPPADYDSPKFDLPTIEVSTVDGYAPALTTVRDFVTASTT